MILGVEEVRKRGNGGEFCTSGEFYPLNCDCHLHVGLEVALSCEEFVTLHTLEQLLLLLCVPVGGCKLESLTFRNLDDMKKLIDYIIYII